VIPYGVSPTFKNPIKTFPCCKKIFLGQKCPEKIFPRPCGREHVISAPSARSAVPSGIFFFFGRSSQKKPKKWLSQNRKKWLSQNRKIFIFSIFRK
jgi:hypothetical protein